MMIAAKAIVHPRAAMGAENMAAQATNRLQTLTEFHHDLAVSHCNHFRRTCGDWP
jgi:hypothetical protein